MKLDPLKAYDARVVMLSGEEESLRRRSLADLLAIATQDGDFDLQTFEADENAPIEWFASAGTAPFLSQKRTVIVRHLLRREPSTTRSGGEGEPKASATEIAARLKDLPPTSLLILVADEEGGDESKQRRLQAVRKAWEKLVKEAGGLVAEFSTNSKQLGEAIKAEAVRLGKKISDASAESLADMTGANLSRAAEELEKLAIYVGDESQIREADIRAVVVPSREWNVYKLVDAIVDGAVPEALRQLRILVGSQTRAEEAALSRILPTLSRQLRLMWQARLCVEARCSPDDPPESVRALLPGKPNIASELPYRQGRLMQQARRVDLPALRRCFESVSDADAKLKGLVDSFSPIETLEEMVLEMVQEIGAKAAVR
ncbi:MAG TPA: DNA polymerase III subunit delta [Fimbriimonadaceae bacterium]|nr:DNA polymerase III subunit delta [Fimbriimonadaceae bacterium]